MTQGPLAAYRALRRDGNLKPDSAQELAAEKLESLHHALVGYQPATGPTGWRARLGLARRQREPAPQGLYLFGGVGRGKSMLMDLFFASAPVARKRRVHFHAFMLEVHARLHELRRNRPKEPEPLRPLARALAKETRLLCFDEFVVADIADAMILGRLFETLLDRGVVVVATSNFPPRRLYEDGLQRDLFVPFIELIEDRLEVVAIDGEVDWRLERLRGLEVYHAPLGAATTRALDDAFARLTDDAEGEPEEIAVGARRLAVPRQARGVAYFEFADLCARALGAADYLALTERYHTLVLAGVPRLTPDRRNEARRFMTLVDALYERRRNLVIGAEVPASELYPKGDGAFEFQRTVSRLMEMQSKDYVDSAQARARHRPAKPFAPFALTSDIT